MSGRGGSSQDNYHGGRGRGRGGGNRGRGRGNNWRGKRKFGHQQDGSSQSHKPKRPHRNQEREFIRDDDAMDVDTDTNLNQGSSSSSSSSSITTTTTAAAPMEIPGYYYDTEKKKYFKMLKHAPSSHPYSADAIKLKEEEARMQANTQERAKSIKSVSNLSSFLIDRELVLRGVRNPWESLANKLSFRETKTCCQSCPADSPITDFQIHPKYDLALYGIRGHGISFGQTCDSRQSCRTVSRQVTKTKVSFLTDTFDEQLILATFNGTNELGASVSDCAMFIVPFCLNEFVLPVEFRVEGSVLCCGAQEWTSLIGGTGGIYCFPGFDLNQRPMHLRTKSKRNDVLTMNAYGQYNILAGTRNGELYNFDQRERQHDAILNLHSPVCWIKKLRHDDSFICATSSGKIHRYDLRMLSYPLVSYEGIGDSRLHVQTVDCDVDTDESLLFGVGLDQHLRCWSKDNGRLLFQRPLEGIDRNNTSYTPIVRWDKGGEVTQSAAFLRMNETKSEEPMKRKAGLYVSRPSAPYGVNLYTYLF